jgi:uncharacterized membrane protein
MSRRGLLIALIVSLAVNLFVLGGLAGMAVIGGFHRHPPSPPPGGPGRLNGIGASLAPEHRQAWQATMRSAVETALPQMRQARTLRHAAWSAIAAEPANPQAAISQLDQSRALEGQARAVMDRAVVGFAVTLPREDRAKLAEALSHRDQRRGPPGGPQGPWSGDSRPGPGPGGPDGGPDPDRPTLPDR